MERSKLINQQKLRKEYREQRWVKSQSDSSRYWSLRKNVRFPAYVFLDWKKWQGYIIRRLNTHAVRSRIS